jgi:hypothetical protein
MNPEIYKIEIPRRVIVFFIARTIERADYFDRRLANLIGAACVGPQCYAINSDVSPDSLREELGPFKDGDCVYFISAAGGILENYLLVPPRQD